MIRKAEYKLLWNYGELDLDLGTAKAENIKISRHYIDTPTGGNLGETLRTAIPIPRPAGILRRLKYIFKPAILRRARRLKFANIPKMTATFTATDPIGFLAQRIIKGIDIKENGESHK